MEIPIQIPISIHEKPIDGSLINVLEFIKICPNFTAERLYIISTAENGDTSGNHSHLNQSQIICLVKGAATLILTNKKEQTYKYDLKNHAVFIPREHWIVLKLAPNTSVICIATKSYSQVKTINNYEEFLRL